ncbi:MAG TPA: protein kinase [Blastocatellia bacterium]|nr:protein kinase [Blastocatellia bacterium]
MSTKDDRYDSTQLVGAAATSPDTSPDSALSTRSALQPADLLKDRYLIEKELGRGGMGVVYLARDRQLHSRPVVIKLLLDDAAHGGYFKKKFRQEIEALALIDHPGIVGALDTGETPDGRPYLVMQFIEGCDLRSAINPRGMDFDRAAHILRQIGQALDAAHNKGILHRDLKPENIRLQTLAGGDEQARLIDFGIASVRDSRVTLSDHTTEVAGTLAYMAPEQFVGKPSPSSDIYAMAVIAYEMVTGRVPFNTTSAVQQYEMQKEGARVKPSDLRPDLPPAAEKLILRALSFNPKDRPATARELGDSLARALGSPAPAERDASERETVRLETATRAITLPRRRSVWLGISGAIILLAVALGYGLWPRSQPDQPGIATGERSLNFSVTVMRGENTFQEPSRPSSEIEFRKGDRIKLNISSPQKGYLYILNQGPFLTGGGPTYVVLYPRAGSALIDGEQEVRVPDSNRDWLLIDQAERAEKIWIVWSENSVAELEEVKSLANPMDRGLISDAAHIRAVQDFLSQHSARKPSEQKDEVKDQINLKLKDRVLVHLLKMEPR